MGTHRNRRSSKTGRWYLLALFAEYPLIGTVWLLGMAVMIGARSFSMIPFGLTLVTTVSIAYAATHLRGTLRELVLDEDLTSGTGRKTSHASPRHRTANA